MVLVRVLFAATLLCFGIGVGVWGLGFTFKYMGELVGRGVHVNRSHINMS